jgi:mannose-6-phosphate isomerase-like protein (cupin superfamily)
MKNIGVRYDKDWKVLAKTRRSEAAVMVIPPGKSEGGPGNEHPKSDQWLYVVEGAGKAVVNNKEVPIHKGSLLLIQAGEKHQIRNTGHHALRTLNLYSPPAY